MTTETTTADGDPPPAADSPKPKSRRGFACMTPEMRTIIARKGGRTAQALGVGHKFTVEEAVAAGRKGGIAAHAKGNGRKWTAEEAVAAGRNGGRKAAEKRHSEDATNVTGEVGNQP